MKKFHKLLIVLNVLVLAATGLVILRISDLRHDCAMENAALYWGEGEEYAQVSFYYSVLGGFTPTDAYSKRVLVEKELKSQGVTFEEGEGCKWIDCAYGEITAHCLSESNRKTDAVVTGVWGDFFTFHPETLITGSYIYPDTANYDVAVLDDLSSWRLFGSCDTVGLNFMIGDKLFRVVGVIEAPTDKTELKAYGSDPHIYIPADAMPLISDSAKLTVYEMCIPEKVRNFGTTIASKVDKDAFDAGNVVDQTRRFDLIELVATHKNIPETAIVRAGFSYPWFENLARMGELQARILAFPAALALLITAFSLVVLMFESAKGAGLLARKAYGRFDNERQKKLSKIYYKTHKTPEEREKEQLEQEAAEREARRLQAKKKPIPPRADNIPAPPSPDPGEADKAPVIPEETHDEPAEQPEAADESAPADTGNETAPSGE